MITEVASPSGNEDKHDVVRQEAVQQIICDWEELQAYVYNPRTNDLLGSWVEYKPDLCMIDSMDG